MSRLIKRLCEVSESIAPTLGFKTATTAPARQMLLIAAFPKIDAVQAAMVTEADVDAVLIHSQALEKDIKAIRKVTDNAGDIPWGIWAEVVSEKGIKELTENKGDFLVFVASQSPASLLGEEIGKVICPSQPIDDGLIGTIDQLTIDAILLDFRGEGGSITVSNLMDCRRFTGSTRKPLLAAIEDKINEKELQALWEVGVNGIVVDIEEESQSEIKRLYQAIGTLSRTQRKSKGQRVILPRLEGDEGSVMPEEI